MDVEHQKKISDEANKGKSQSSRRANYGISDFFQLSNDLRPIRGLFSPLPVLIITIGGIAIAEVIAMIFVYYYRFLPYYQQILLDATIMTVIIFPLLYFLSLRPLLLHIQQRRHAEQVLMRANQVLERTFSNIYSPTAYLDRGFNFLRVNQAYAQSDGREASFFIGKNHFELYPNAENEAIFRKVVETGEPYIVYEKPFVYLEHPERGVTYWDWSLQPVKGDSGEIEGLVLNLLDVTGQRQSKEQLREMALFPILNPDAVLQVDATGQIKMTNPAAAQLGLCSGAQVTEIIPELGDVDLPACIASGNIQEILQVRLGERILQWTILGAPELGLAFLYSTDITKRKQAESITQTRLGLMQYANTHTLDELLQFTLDEIEALTGSTIGFFHFLEADQKTLWLQAWSTNTLKNMCKAEGKDSHYDVEQAGVWADCVHQHQPVIHNDYASLPHRKGMPEGHATVIREMAVPIMRDEKIVAILGMGNKPQDYTASDVELVSTLADYSWDVVERKRAEIGLRESEVKFRTLLDWTYDWEIWIDPQDIILYSSPACEHFTGYRPEEFIADPELLKCIVHPDDVEIYEEHIIRGHDDSAGVLNLEYRIIARDGNEHWVGHICRSLFGPDNRHLGRRVSNRDITERKQAEKEIRERDQKEKILTQTLHSMQIDIVRDLHDTIGQNISFLRMKLDHLSETELPKETDLQIEIQSMSEVASEAYNLIQGMLAVFQSGNSIDLLSLFTRYAEQVAERSSLQIEITNQGNPKQLSAHQIRQLFYIFREALSNIEKYASAGQVSVEFSWDEDSLTLVISDNGRGFDLDRIPPGDHYGLKFMGERTKLLNGSFSVHSAVGLGTKITVHVPYEEGSFIES